MTDLVFCCITSVLFPEDTPLWTGTCRNIKYAIITYVFKEQVCAACWFSVVNNEEPSGSTKAVNFSTSWATLTVARLVLLHGVVGLYFCKLVEYTFVI